MKRQYLIALALLAVAATPATTPSSETAKAAAAEHRVFAADDIKWADGPASLPKGAKMAVLSGDPKAPGVFTMRLTLPAGYKIPPHTHPADENVTILSGEFHMAMGDKWDDTKGHALTAGSFSTMPKGTRHYAWSKTGAVLQLNGMGPWGITYVNPADDPRNVKEAAK